MANEWRWKVGEFIQREGSQVLEQITDVVICTHPNGGRAVYIFAGGPCGYQGQQSDFENAGWRRFDPPQTGGAT
jgi:hypothetical protein